MIQREADVLSTLSQNTQNLRASATQQTQTIARLETRNTDLDRQLALLGAQERNARATLRSAETRTKVLKEEMARLKVTVAQIRGQCATDIRRRDGEINRLKRHLERRRGREGIGGQVGVVVVTPGLNKMQRGGRDAEVGVDLGRPDYSLKQETTEFLTQLSQGLSDENDALIELVKGTLATLRSLQGLPMILEQGSERSTSAEGQAVESGVVFLAPPPSCKVLTTDMGEVLEHLRSLLTNPSFVPLEELEVREDEIIRLREGWEKMEARWREAVALMDGWRKRMMSTGDTINLDDLTIGLNLGSGIPSAEETNEEVLSHKGDDGEQTEYNTSDKIQGDVEGLPGTYESFGNIRQQGDGLEMDLCPASKPLRASSGNARPFFTSIKSSIPVIPEEFTESTSNSIDPDEVSLLDFSASKDSQPLKQARSHLAKKVSQATWNLLAGNRKETVLII